MWDACALDTPWCEIGYMLDGVWVRILRGLANYLLNFWILLELIWDAHALDTSWCDIDFVSASMRVGF